MRRKAHTIHSAVAENIVQGKAPDACGSVGGGMRSCEAIRCELVSDVLRDFGSVTFRVQGTSMVPALAPGDLVTVCRCHISQVQFGDVILFRRDGRLFLHRVVERRPCGQGVILRTRGDRLRGPDPSIGCAEFLGRMTAAFRGSHPISAASRPYSLLQFLWRYSDSAVSLVVSTPWLRPLLGA